MLQDDPETLGLDLVGLKKSLTKFLPNLPHDFPASQKLLLRAGTTPILKKKAPEFGLIFWRPTNSESRSGICSKNRVFT